MAQAAVVVVKEHEFQWEGTDRKGARVKGVTQGPNENAVRMQLRRQGVNPIRVRKNIVLFKTKRKITSGDISIFSRQLATMMAAGVPLVQSLEIVGRGHENPSMSELILGVKTNIESGRSLAESLAQYPLHFDDLFIHLVDAGERSGTLETLLDKIATYKEKTEKIKKKVKKALIYPSAVVCVAFIVTGIMLYFVVPQFQSLFEGFGADLPAFTMMVVHLSHFVRDFWWLMFAVIGGSVFAFIYFKKRSLKMRRAIDRIGLKFPVVGDILYKSAVARFARTLSTMFAAGVPLVEALTSVAKASGNIVFEDAINVMKEQVASGQQLQLAMQQSNIFPNMAVQMVAIGEESGSLDQMCAKVADFYEDEVDNLVDALTSLLEPMIMAVLGVLVGGLVVAMYLPIFKLGQAI
ncbi:type II secretion system protein F (GspF) [Panacagrimonas perspica]|uniref:Type II secretion system protein F (GspF) n=1 Tax=Panacagrimonas perspica TaxID=381431 RepID=A0A4R7P586_9GAMM|nr:type II secretion system F family protein [Panacagrimonas perspica]TDU28411.1 type II secretion system protein F (GspF) [Panacagrimonas perspica]THD01068.1 type II secretion system protein F [Panacagrimonas perspica]